VATFNDTTEWDSPIVYYKPFLGNRDLMTRLEQGQWELVPCRADGVLVWCVLGGAGHPDDPARAGETLPSLC
jgi:hypothetical protein